MGTIDDWTRLCNLLDDDPAFATSVTDAIEAGDDPWDALVSTLDDAGDLAYLDRSDTGAELAEALPPLPRIFRAGVDLELIGDLDSLSDAVTAASETLAPYGLTLIHIDDPEDEDAYPLIAVPTKNVDEIHTLITTVRS